MGKGKFSSPISVGNKGQPPNMPGSVGKGSKHPTTVGTKGVPPMSGVKSHKAPKD